MNALLVSTVSSESIFFFFKRREVYKTAITVDYSNSPFLSVQGEGEMKHGPKPSHL